MKPPTEKEMCQAIRLRKIGRKGTERITTDPPDPKKVSWDYLGEYNKIILLNLVRFLNRNKFRWPKK